MIVYLGYWVRRIITWIRANNKMSYAPTYEFGIIPRLSGQVNLPKIMICMLCLFSPREPFLRRFCTFFFTIWALANWASPNYFSVLLHSWKPCQNARILRHNTQLLWKLIFRWLYTCFINMEFFNQQRHNIPKSGVLLVVVIILRVQEATLWYRSLSTGQVYTTPLWIFAEIFRLARLLMFDVWDKSGWGGCVQC